MGTKLKDILKESVLGELPSSKMFKLNKATGKFEAPGQHTTNEEIIKEEYVESMGPEFDKAMNMITMAWQKWKRGPMTEPHMINPAKKELVKYFESWLK